MRTPTVSRLSTSNSSHAPRPGITLTLCSVFSVDLSMFSSKYTPGERTSCDTTTRSVPLMMKVPFSVIIGKSPMKTVWLLISPVVLLMNSAVTNSGAAYVMSLSLHSSTGAFTSSKRGSENDSDSVPAKSSIGDSSASTSSRPPTGSDVTAVERPLTPTIRADEPLERVGLHVEQPRNLEGFAELGEGDSVGCSRNGVVGIY